MTGHAAEGCIIAAFFFYVNFSRQSPLGVGAELRVQGSRGTQSQQPQARQEEEVTDSVWRPTKIAPDPKPFRARYEGTCLRCFKPTRPGQMASRAKHETGYVHADKKDCFFYAE